jgi:nucleotide-binding universal stress UspA family protein
MIKDNIVNLEHQIAHDPARDFAITVAETFDTHVAGVAFVYIPEFSGLCDAGENSTRYDGPDGRRERESRSSRDRTFRDDMIETSLFQSGRPVIVVPYTQKDGLKLDRVVCCWDGCRAAARAFNDALPLLVKATKVELLIVLNEKTAGAQREIRGVEMAKHLARHDVNVQIETVPAADIDVTNAILSYVADNSGSLIVMGGYGHAKLREVILGGVTRDMLQSMTVPVFMSH